MPGVSQLADRAEAVVDSSENCGQTGGSSVSIRINRHVSLTEMVTERGRTAWERRNTKYKGRGKEYESERVEKYHCAKDRKGQREISTLFFPPV